MTMIVMDSPRISLCTRPLVETLDFAARLGLGELPSHLRIRSLDYNGHAHTPITYVHTYFVRSIAHVTPPDPSNVSHEVLPGTAAGFFRYQYADSPP